MDAIKPIIKNLDIDLTEKFLIKKITNTKNKPRKAVLDAVMKRVYMINTLIKILIKLYSFFSNLVKKL